MKMGQCRACKAIVLKDRHAPGHKALVPSGERIKLRNYGQPHVFFQNWTCKKCGANWMYEDDKNERTAGWAPGHWLIGLA